MYVLVFSECLLVLFFFFFQAEDGIRDADVTGVQTCALPIYAVQGRRLQPVLQGIPPVHPQRRQGVGAFLEGDQSGAVVADAPGTLVAVVGVQLWLISALAQLDRKSTRLNSSHVRISYAVFCLKKKR